MKWGIALDLRAHFWRGVEQEPRIAVRAHRHALLRTRLGGDRARSSPLAVRAAAVPLREAATRGRAQNVNLHVAQAPETSQPLATASRAARGAVKARREARVRRDQDSTPLKSSRWKSSWYELISQSILISTNSGFSQVMIAPLF